MFSNMTFLNLALAIAWQWYTCLFDGGGGGERALNGGNLFK